MAPDATPDEPETGAGAPVAPRIVPVTTTLGPLRPTATSGQPADAFVEYCLRLADDRLVLGHRLSEWCGHAPILEEDIALANIALDLIGQAEAFFSVAAEAEGRGRTPDDFAYFRDDVAFRNAMLCELPNGDFGVTIARQFLWTALQVPFTKALSAASHAQLAGAAAKAHKEHVYHLRHAADWVLKLGDGTPESHARVQAALDGLWPYTDELFYADGVDAAVAALVGAPVVTALREDWARTVEAVLRQATLSVPVADWTPAGGRLGRHTEHLGHMLAEMQSLARAHPGAQW
ncbi:MAG: 1,2-phenylacetyl-CoA epoxidase subunit PaaC [Gemmatimonadota bacterium]|jgi:ring-1,2-phenylacetyl-CoA epoxidase subunit PaaC|nr:phenylacetate-CoA oxygenase subunit PaaC [Gemmatimonadota bacterium]